MRIGDGKGGADGALGVVLVRARIAEVREHGVADLPRDDAAVRRDDIGAALAVSLDDVGELFRIEPQRQRRRCDHVAQHHGELATLGRPDVGHGAAGAVTSTRSYCVSRTRAEAVMPGRSSAAAD